MDNVIVQTKYGSYVGRKSESDIIAFKGIPYAKPPIGPLRWKAPEKPDICCNTVEAFDFGHSCIQPINEIAAASLMEQGEDCLNLNIWTRSTDARKRPVMVFIHGGSFVGSGASDPWYCGENFVKRHDIVFVSVDYRCNVLGFLDLEEIGGEEYADSKNAGILDQISALEWVKENIHLFGGDADNITVFGESAGSISLSLLLASPRAKGLFHKAILESGAPNLRKSLAEATKQARDFIKHAGANTIRELMALNQDGIRDACNGLMQEYGYKNEVMFVPVADGNILPFDPYEEIKNGSAAGIRLMIGTTADEVCYWKLYYRDIEGLARQILEEEAELLSLDLNQHEKEIEHYLSLKPDLSRGFAYIPLTTDLMFRVPSIKLAELQSKHADTWMYLFAWPSAIEGLGACHAIELPFVFHNEDAPSAIAFTGENPPKALADRIQDAWVAFAETGNPSHAGIPVWPKYEDRTRKTMIIHEDWHVEESPGNEERSILKRIFE